MFLCRYEHLVSVEFFGIEACGGTLYDSNWVITAAHCVDYAFGQKNLEIAYHRHNLDKSVEDENGQAVKVDKLWVHPMYNSSTLQYDIAVLHLEGDGVTGLSDTPLVELDDGAYLR